jgi:hypothetical protein
VPGFGVELREVDHGEKDPTAAARYDFSGLAFEAESMCPARRSSLSAAPPFRCSDQADVDSTRDAGRYRGMLRARRLRRLANVIAVPQFNESRGEESLFRRSLRHTTGEYSSADLCAEQRRIAYPNCLRFGFPMCSALHVPKHNL